MQERLVQLNHSHTQLSITEYSMINTVLELTGIQITRGKAITQYTEIDTHSTGVSAESV